VYCIDEVWMSLINDKQEKAVELLLRVLVQKGNSRSNLYTVLLQDASDINTYSQV
jgi:hypothetical protein